MVLREMKKDLFSLPKEYSLAHCISYDCAMGKGIAYTFAKKFPSMKQKLLEHIKKCNEPFHPCAIGIRHNNRYIFNLVTKNNYWQKPTYSTLRKSLEELKKLCIKLHITKLGMPRIGCGLDRLEWNKVKEILKYVFNDMDIEIIVCKK